MWMKRESITATLWSSDAQVKHTIKTELNMLSLLIINIWYHECCIVKRFEDYKHCSVKYVRTSISLYVYRFKGFCVLFNLIITFYMLFNTALKFLFYLLQISRHWKRIKTNYLSLLEEKKNNLVCLIYPVL